MGILFFCERRNIAAILMAFNTLIAFPAPSLLSTLWISRKILSNNVWRRQSLMNKMDDSNMMELSIEHDKNIKTASNREDRFLETLQNENKFEAFVQFVYREFNQEILLCFIELVQFKAALIGFKKKNSDTIKGEDIEYQFIDLLYGDMPKSSIVEKKSGHDGIERFRNIAHLLFAKYINYYAEFEVNISSDLRNQYVAHDNNKWVMEVHDFVLVFEPLINEMLYFMRQSFMRYENTVKRRSNLHNGL